MSVCIWCKRDREPFEGERNLTRAVTCSEACHDALLDYYVGLFGETKRVTDASTGKTHLVPTRTIMEDGLKHGDLSKYPVAES